MSGKSLFTRSSIKTPGTAEEISAFLGKETVFEGKMTFQGVFRLEGKFQGEIFESGTLIVGESAFVKAKIDVHTIIIHGRVEGDLHATGRVEIDSMGKFYGNLLTPSLMVNEGGILEGYCKMGKADDDKEDDLHLLSHKEEASSRISVASSSSNPVHESVATAEDMEEK